MRKNLRGTSQDTEKVSGVYTPRRRSRCFSTWREAKNANSGAAFANHPGMCTTQGRSGAEILSDGRLFKQGKRSAAVWCGRQLRSKCREHYTLQYSPALLLRAFFVQIAKSLAICCFRNHSSLQPALQVKPRGYPICKSNPLGLTALLLPSAVNDDDIGPAFA